MVKAVESVDLSFPLFVSIGSRALEKILSLLALATFLELLRTWVDAPVRLFLESVK
jgi:hypothetical protein